MPDRLLVKPEPDPVYIELVTVLFDVEALTWTAALMLAMIGGYLALELRDPVIAALTLGNLALLVPRVLLLRAFQRMRAAAGGTLPDAATAAAWELRYAMGLILFAVCLSALSLRTFASGDPPLQMLSLAMMFSFGSGIVARVSVRPLICALALLVALVPTMLAVWGDPAPHNDVLAFGLLLFLLSGLGTARHSYGASRHHITIAQDMARTARKDPLTGLLNRLGLRQAFAGLAPDRAMRMVAVHYCDLDGFKPVNDRYGHPAGDQVLATVAARIRDALRPTDLAARVGGDEFIVVQAPVAHPDEVAAFARRLDRLFAKPHLVAGTPLCVGVSIGSAAAAAPWPDLDRLLAEADRALYVAKQDGRAAARAPDTPAAATPTAAVTAPSGRAPA